MFEQRRERRADIDDVLEQAGAAAGRCIRGLQISVSGTPMTVTSERKLGRSGIGFVES